MQDVLAYSKVSKDQTALQPIPLGPLIDDILRNYAGLREKATITLDQPLPFVIGHEGYLSQCIANIFR